MLTGQIGRATQTRPGHKKTWNGVISFPFQAWKLNSKSSAYATTGYSSKKNNKQRQMQGCETITSCNRCLQKYNTLVRDAASYKAIIN